MAFVFLENRLDQELRLLSKALIKDHTAMPNLKSVTKELHHEIVSYLIPFPIISSSLAFPLATLIFAKTRFCSHINFIGCCLQSKDSL